MVTAGVGIRCRLGLTRGGALGLSRALGDTKRTTIVLLVSLWLLASSLSLLQPLPCLGAGGCSLSAPALGSLGGCGTSLADDASCQFACAVGNGLESTPEATKCSAGQSSLQNCAECPAGTRARLRASVQKIVGSGAIGTAYQGASSAISADGKTIVWGGTNDDSRKGAVWVAILGDDGIWTEQAKITGSDPAGYQGCAVAISADGNTIVWGAFQDSASKGAVRVATRTGSTWTQQGLKIVGTPRIGDYSYSGYSISVSSDGNTLVWGGPLDDSDQGAVWIATRDNNGQWTQQAKLIGLGGIGPNGIAVSKQGSSISVSSDGNTLVWGGPNDDAYKGAVWIATRTGSSWSTPIKITATVTYPVYQGDSVSVSGDGNTIAWGGVSYSNSMGAVWVVTRTGSSWSEPILITATDATDRASQGKSVSLSSDGNRIVWGGNYDNNNKGAVWIATRDLDGVWTQQGDKNVGATTATGYIYQGVSVSLSPDGAAIVWGGNQDSGAGAVWVGYLFSECYACVAGSYCPGSTASAEKCPAGTYTALTNADAVSDCECCPTSTQAGDKICASTTTKAEECNGMDDNCDGFIDNVLGDGDSCGSKVGICAGHRTCDLGNSAQICFEPASETETCNGLDDDCDGSIDNVSGNGDSCGSKVGICVGHLACDLDNSAQVCIEATPQTEICNGLDDDCDGDIDEGLGCADLETSGSTLVSGGSYAFGESSLFLRLQPSALVSGFLSLSVACVGLDSQRSQTLEFYWPDGSALFAQATYTPDFYAEAEVTCTFAHESGSDARFILPGSITFSVHPWLSLSAPLIVGLGQSASLVVTLPVGLDSDSLQVKVTCAKGRLRCGGKSAAAAGDQAADSSSSNCADPSSCEFLFPGDSAARATHRIEYTAPNAMTESAAQSDSEANSNPSGDSCSAEVTSTSTLVLGSGSAQLVRLGSAALIHLSTDLTSGVRSIESGKGSVMVRLRPDWPSIAPLTFTATCLGLSQTRLYFDSIPAGSVSAVSQTFSAGADAETITCSFALVGVEAERYSIPPPLSFSVVAASPLRRFLFSSPEFAPSLLAASLPAGALSDVILVSLSPPLIQSDLDAAQAADTTEFGFDSASALVTLSLLCRYSRQPRMRAQFSLAAAAVAYPISIPLYYTAPVWCGVEDQCEWKVEGPKVIRAGIEVPIWTKLAQVAEPKSSRRRFKNIIREKQEREEERRRGN